MAKIIAEALGDFPFTFYIEKAQTYEEGDNLFVEGIASTVNIDHDNERMAEPALRRMRDIVNEKGVPLRLEHQKSDDAVVGNVFKAWIDERNQMWIRAALEKANPVSKILYDSLKSGVKLGLSIGGRVKSAAREMSEAAGKAIQTFYDIQLDEVSVTQKPANYDAWLFAKSIIQKGEDGEKYRDTNLYEEFLFQNPHLDYLQAIAKSIPDEAWKKVDKITEDSTMKKENETETTEETKTKASETTETTEEKSTKSTETEETTKNGETTEETTTGTTKNTDETTETTKNYVSRQEFNALKSIVEQGFTNVANLVKSMATTETTEETTKGREGQETTTEANGTDETGTRESKSQAKKTDVTETEQTEHTSEYEMKSLKSAVDSLKKSASTEVTKSKSEPGLDAFVFAVTDVLDKFIMKSEKDGKRIVGLHQIVADLIKNDNEIQKSMKEWMSQPGPKQSVAFGVPYIKDRSGKQFALTAVEIAAGVQKSKSEGKTFKELYQTELSAFGGGKEQ